MLERLGDGLAVDVDDPVVARNQGRDGGGFGHGDGEVPAGPVDPLAVDDAAEVGDPAGHLAPEDPLEILDFDAAPQLECLGAPAEPPVASLAVDVVAPVVLEVLGGGGCGVEGFEGGYHWKIRA